MNRQEKAQILDRFLMPTSEPRILAIVDIFLSTPRISSLTGAWLTAARLLEQTEFDRIWEAYCNKTMKQAYLQSTTDPKPWRSVK